ncbi:MAG: tetratricopeptide repeat protein [Acidobacteriota bacterium]
MSQTGTNSLPALSQLARAFGRSTLAAFALTSLGAVACTGYVEFDEQALLDRQLESRLPESLRGLVVPPYQVSEGVVEEASVRVRPNLRERDRVDAILDYIFGTVGLEYELTPTRSADRAALEGKGNCMSFVNLFVGLGRENRLNPFYVEVKDYQRWNYQDGVVVSRGHIVAGLYVDGNLRTYDFLPYAPKSYKDFKPIEDLTAMAHHYNNLGAEALMENRLAEATRNLELARLLDRDFDKAINNFGVALLRNGRAAEAVELYRDGLDRHPVNVPIMTNLARAYQQTGETQKANELFDQLEKINRTNPFFYVYRGDLALANGDTKTALQYMKRAYQTDAELPEVHVGLAKVYLALGSFSEARHHVGRALRLDATHTEARKYASLLDRRAPKATSAPEGR